MAKNKIVLNEKQQKLYDIVLNQHKNIFFTGCGGTGKSFIIKKVVDDLHLRHPSSGSIVVTASTGRAAFNIKGTTLHSFAGIGLGVEPAETLARRISLSSKGLEKWTSVKVLIVDEISMISGELFDKIEHISRVVRKSNEPFGGIQLVLVGDLLQLPPVSTTTKVQRVFQASSWDKCIKDYVRLDDVFRQSDPEFIKALCCIRVGAVTEQVLSFMQTATTPKKYEEELEPVNLYSRKDKADNFNSNRLSMLTGDTKTYSAKDRVLQGSNTLLQQCPAPSILSLKIGAQVMLVKNLTKELVNGTVGVVTGFTKSAFKENINLGKVTNVQFGSSSSVPLPIVRFTMANNRMYTTAVELQTWETVLPSGQIQSSRIQIPLILSWAITIHKSQGQTIQRLRVDLEGIFESGQVYTALSRAVDIKTLEVLNFNPDSIKVDQDSLNFCMEKDLI